jgi:UDP-N-acetylglucosamine transferase subunit ALG13
VIFLTVGTQLPFDRLIAAMEAWAGTQSGEVVAQVGPSKLTLRHMIVKPFMTADEMESCYSRCNVVVAHAGMGSILSALRHRKPIIIVPRKAALGEHRNDHQLATARWMASRPGVLVAWEPEQVMDIIQRQRESPADAGGLTQFASPDFTSRLREFMLSD